MQSLKKSFLCNKVETKAISVLKPHVYFDVIPNFLKIFRKIPFQSTLEQFSKRNTKIAVN